MKKIRLSIPEPCHENWNGMSAAEKGRFCASCQKQVIDFTAMSDRQLAAFFKKPASSVCGRLGAHQINRTIEIPRKKIPWAQYFFRVSWPAFVLFLKACGDKDARIGVMKVSKEAPFSPDPQPVKEMTATVGLLMPVESIDSMPFTPPVIKGDIEVKVTDPTNEKREAERDSIILPQKAIDDSLQWKEAPETIPNVQPIVPYQDVLWGTLGGIVCTRQSDAIDTSQQVKTVSMPIKENIHPSFSVFPNPVHPGGLLTFSFEKEGDMPSQLTILSASGQIIQSIHEDLSADASVFNLRMPANVPPGTYYIFMQGRHWSQPLTATIIVQ